MSAAEVVSPPMVKAKPKKDLRVLRIVEASAADLDERQRALAAEYGLTGEKLDEYARNAMQAELFRTGRSGFSQGSAESDEAYDLRRRRERMLMLAAEMVMRLHGDSGEDDAEILRYVVAVEKAKASLTGPTRDKSAQATRVRAVFEAVEAGKKLKWPANKNPDMEFRIDRAREHATEIDPELGKITKREWRSAIEQWPESHRSAGRPPQGAPPSWKEIVWSMLSKHGLTGASDPAAMARNWSPPK